MKLAIGVKKDDYSWIAVFIGYLNDMIEAIGKLLALFNGLGKSEEKPADEVEGE